MVNILAYSRRVRMRRISGMVLFFFSALMIAADFVSRLSEAAKLETSVLWVFGLCAGLVLYYWSLELPKQEILQLAESKQGLLTLSEISTALNIDPDLALRTLHHLQRIGVASPRWAEIQKNLWEFPDYVKLPITETIDLARAKGGRISLQELVARGHTPDVARQTLDALSDKGLASPDPQNAQEVVLAIPA